LTNIQRRKEGAREFHKIRKEILIVERGMIELELEDLSGQESKYKLKEGDIFYFVSPFTFHLYRGVADTSSIIVLANTTYCKDESESHDTYSEDEFKRLQEKDG